MDFNKPQKEAMGSAPTSKYVESNQFKMAAKTNQSKKHKNSNNLVAFTDIEQRFCVVVAENHPQHIHLCKIFIFKHWHAMILLFCSSCLFACLLNFSLVQCIIFYIALFLICFYLFFIFYLFFMYFV